MNNSSLECHQHPCSFKCQWTKIILPLLVLVTDTISNFHLQDGPKRKLFDTKTLHWLKLPANIPGIVTLSSTLISVGKNFIPEAKSNELGQVQWPNCTGKQRTYCFNSGSDFNMFLLLFHPTEVFHLEPADVIGEGSQIPTCHIDKAVGISSAKTVRDRKAKHWGYITHQHSSQKKKKKRMMTQLFTVIASHSASGSTECHETTNLPLADLDLLRLSHQAFPPSQV